MYCFNLDKEAKRHILYLVKNIKNNWKYWDVSEKRSKTFTGRKVKIKAVVDDYNDHKDKSADYWKNWKFSGKGTGGPKDYRSWRPPYIPERGEFDFSGAFWDPRIQ